MRAKLQASMKEALKAKDKIRLDTIRGLLSAIQYEEMSQKVDSLSEESTTALLQRELKKRKEELEFAQTAKRDDLIEKLNAEVKIVQEFLPTLLSDAEIEKILIEFKKSNPASNMGLAMKALKEGYSGKYDGKIASDVAKRIFQ